MDGEGITKDEFLKEYLKDYEFGGEKTLPNEKTPMLNRYFTWPDRNEIVLYIPTDRTTPKGIRLDRTYKFVFDEEDRFSYASIKFDPHAFNYAEENGETAEE